jgi:hypothetical protein
MRDAMPESKSEVPVRGIIPLSEMQGGDAEDSRLLQIMAKGAEHYIRTRPWCINIRESYFGDGYGGIAAVFLYRIVPSRPDVDEWLWVIFGDIPPAYLVIDRCKTPSEALAGYIEEMSKWIELAKQGIESDSVIPVTVAATPENASDLEKRLKFLQEVVVGAFQQAEVERA